jgi:hypothetical protein
MGTRPEGLIRTLEGGGGGGEEEEEELCYREF